MKILCLLTIAITLSGCGGGGGPAGVCLYPKSSCANVNNSETGSISKSNFTRTGTGDNVFDLPTRQLKLRIQATYAGNSSTFIVNVNGRLLLAEAIGTGHISTVFDGTYLIPNGGTVEITNSSGVAWSFAEVQ